MTTGTDVIRDAVRNRRNNAVIAKHLQVSQLVLEQFIASERELPKEAMQTLTEYLFGGHLVFDPDADLLRTTVNHQAAGMARPPVAPLGPKFKNDPIAHAPHPDGRQNVTSDAYRKPAGLA
ncbi:hypothetical protein [Bradyrhizobium elkanii]